MASSNVDTIKEMARIECTNSQDVIYVYKRLSEQDYTWSISPYKYANYKLYGTWQWIKGKPQFIYS